MRKPHGLRCIHHPNGVAPKVMVPLPSRSFAEQDFRSGAKIDRLGVPGEKSRDDDGSPIRQAIFGFCPHHRVDEKASDEDVESDHERMESDGNKAGASSGTVLRASRKNASPAEECNPVQNKLNGIRKTSILRNLMPAARSPLPKQTLPAIELPLDRGAVKIRHHQAIPIDCSRRKSLFSVTRGGQMCALCAGRLV